MPTRPNITLAVKRLIRDVAARIPELAHVRASRVLVVAGEARGTSRASIRAANVGPAREPRPRRFVRFRGKRMLYVMTLRPLWFAASTPEERVGTILHELYHASARFDGTLHRGRRHSTLPRAVYDRTIRSLLTRYLSSATPEVLAPFAAEGLVKVRMWLRVPRATERVVGGLEVEPHLMMGVMPLRSRPEELRRPPRAAPRQRRPASRTRRRPSRHHPEEEGT